MPKGELGTSRPYLRGKIWWIRYTNRQGREVRESTGSTEKKDAVKKLNERRSQADGGTLSPSNVTIGDLLDLYLSEQEHRKQIQKAKGYVKLHLRPAFGLIAPHELTTAHLNSFVDMKRRAGKANATINRCLEALKRSFTLGLQNTPPLVIKAPKIVMLSESENVREGFISHEQYIAMRNELPTHQRLILVIGYHLGMRRGEILSLRWDQVDWDQNLIRLDKSQTKGKRARYAPMFGELRGWLEMAFDDKDRGVTIVSFRGQKIAQAKTSWNKARERAGLPDLLIHDLRRTAVRNMVRAGVPEKQAMLISGHKTRSMFDRYDITDERDIQNAGEKMALYLEGQSKVRTKVRTVEIHEIQKGVN